MTKEAIMAGLGQFVVTNDSNSVQRSLIRREDDQPNTLICFAKVVFLAVNASKGSLDISDPGDQLLLFKFIQQAEQKFKTSNVQAFQVILGLKKCLIMAHTQRQSP